MTLSLVLCILGLLLWAVFTKWTKVADGWVASVGEKCFWVGLLAYLLVAGTKAIL